MEEERTYTLDEVEERTGFDKRTIAYYVQEGLLPKIGRRGPKTRYPREFLDRLMFIRKTRDLQDRGRMGTMTLGEIKDLFDRVPDRKIHDMVTGEEPLHFDDHPATLSQSQPMASPGSRARVAARRIGRLFEREKKDSESGEALHSLIELDEMAQQSAEMRFEDEEVTSAESDVGLARFSMPPTAYSQEAPRSLPLEEELRRALYRLLHSVKEAPPVRRGQAEHWARAKVASTVYLTAENLETDDVHLLEDVVRVLRRLILEVDEER